MSCSAIIFHNFGALDLVPRPSPCYNFLYRKSAATPFFDHVSGKILIKGGKVVNDDGVQDADVLVDTAEGTIVAIGTDLEVPGDCKVRQEN